MNIERIQVTVGELIEGYQEKGEYGIEGIFAYGGKLNVRPPFQREYVYKAKERDEVIRSVNKGFPVNVMYWSKIDNNHYELMDGQQRTISICRYAAVSERTFAVDYKYYFNLEEDEQKSIMDYVLDIYVCDGTPSEVLEWFKVINIAGVRLSEQELRNTAYTGTWLSDAKIHFSKPNCTAFNMAKDYIKGSPIRQEYLETAIKWIIIRDEIGTIEDYMALHQHDDNSNQIWIYFKRIIEWTQAIFPVKRKEMKEGVNWGLLYNDFKNLELDPGELEKKIHILMSDDDISVKKGIYPYVLTGNEKFLNIRKFSKSQKSSAYERQQGICSKCGKHFELDEMEADHITPWSHGGKTNSENCQMLCRECNRRKSDK